MADFANQKKVLYIATEPLTDAITMAQGNRYTFRVRPNNTMQVGMLVEQAKLAGVKRWAIVAPNYDYGQSAAAVFKKLFKEKVPDAEIVAEQYPALGKVDAGAIVAALDQAKPDGLFNVLFGSDLTQFVREGNTRGLIREAHRAEPANRRARVVPASKGRGAGRLDRHRLPLGADRGAAAQGVRRGVPPKVSTTRRGSAPCSATSRST
jgi:hypothetical protein